MRPLRYITDEDSAEYSGFFGHHIRGISFRKTATKVFHYTTGDTLIKILKTGKLWSTQASCLNDAQEFLYAVHAFLEVIRDRRKRSMPSEFDLCLNWMETRLKDASVETVPPFVTCFSEVDDDLSQWRAYGGHAGYAIEFDVVKLRQAAAERKDIVLPVLYGREDEARVFLNDVISWAEKFCMDGINAQRAPTAMAWIEEFADYWLWNLSYYAPMIKHEAFKPEAEWRLVHYFADGDHQHMEFLQRNSMMTRHIPLDLSFKEQDGSSKLPITRIVVGPTGNKRVSQVAVSDMLETFGYGDKVKVDVTAIPYRPYL